MYYCLIFLDSDLAILIQLDVTFWPASPLDDLPLKTLSHTKKNKQQQQFHFTFNDLT